MKRSKRVPLWLRNLGAVKAEMKSVRFPRTAQDGFRQCAELSEAADRWLRQSIRDSHPGVSEDEIEKERRRLLSHSSAEGATRIITWNKELARYFGK